MQSSKPGCRGSNVCVHGPPSLHGGPCTDTLLPPLPLPRCPLTPLSAPAGTQMQSSEPGHRGSNVRVHGPSPVNLKMSHAHTHCCPHCRCHTAHSTIISITHCCPPLPRCPPPAPASAAPGRPPPPWPAQRPRAGPRTPAPAAAAAHVVPLDVCCLPRSASTCGGISSCPGASSSSSSSSNVFSLPRSASTCSSSQHEPARHVRSSSRHHTPSTLGGLRARHRPAQSHPPWPPAPARRSWPAAPARRPWPPPARSAARGR